MSTAERIVCDTGMQCLGDVSALPGIPGFWYGVSTVNKLKYSHINMGVYLTNGVRHPIPWAIEKKMWTKFMSYAIENKRFRVFYPAVKGLILRLCSK